MYIISCLNLFSLTSCLLLFYIATHTSLEMAPLQRSKSASQTGQLQIQHFIHQHVLHKLYMTSEFNCDGCNTGGYGVRYRCSACDFDLHEQCATAPHRISANIHPHHLALVNRPGDSHLCHVCKGVTNGLSYMCEVQLCEFNVHALCIQISGDRSLTLDPSQLPVVGGFSGGSNNNQPVLMNQQMQSNSQPMMVNHHPQMQGIQTMQFGGYNGANTSQPMMVNNNNQNHTISHHQQQQMKPIVGYGSFHGVNNNSQLMMVNHHQQQQAYPGGMNSQPVMVNNHHQQQVMPTNQQYVTNQHQQLQLQQQQGMGMPATAVGGYNVVHNNQTVMIHHPPPPPPPPQQSSPYTKVGKLAANVISTSLIGVPIFMPKR
ncbi:putative chromatin regulator PHD family [Helianthus debilis subsp. tardiflorus]